ncbi:MAG: rhomboid family intramembrane serine protease [Aquirhabdus sp.]
MISTLKIWKLTGLLLLINVTVFVLEALSGVNILSPTVKDMLIWGANYAPLTLTGDAWRLFTSMFLHVGIIHLAVNCWALYLWGVYAEFYYGRPYYLALYLSAGLMGSVLSVIHNLVRINASHGDASFIISAGASGAIMGLGGALIVAAWRPKTGLHPAQILLLKPLLVIMAINFALGFSVSGIDNAAHIGGVLTGALLALVFSLTEKCTTSQRKLLRIITFVVLAIGGVFLFLQLEIIGADLQPYRADILSQLANHH